MSTPAKFAYPINTALVTAAAAAAGAAVEVNAAVQWIGHTVSITFNRIPGATVYCASIALTQKLITDAIVHLSGKSSPLKKTQWNLAFQVVVLAGVTAGVAYGSEFAAPLLGGAALTFDQAIALGVIAGTMKLVVSLLILAGEKARVIREANKAKTKNSEQTKIQKEINDAKAASEAANQKVIDAQAELDRLNKIKSDLETQIQTSKDKLPALTTEKDRANASLVEQEGKVGTLKELNDKIKNVIKNSIAADKTSNEAKDKLEIKQRLVQTISTSIKEAEEALPKLQKELDDANLAVATDDESLKKAIEDAQGAFDKQKALITDLNESLKKETAAIATLEAEYNQADIKAKEIKEELEKAQEAKAKSEGILKIISTYEAQISKVTDNETLLKANQELLTTALAALNTAKKEVETAQKNFEAAKLKVPAAK